MCTIISMNRTQAKSFVSSPSAVLEPVFRDYFWNLLIELMPCGLRQPSTCSELFQLAVALFKSMKESKSDVLDLPRTTQFLSQLLLEYKPEEVGILAPSLLRHFLNDPNCIQDIIQPGAVDLGAQGLVGLLHFILCDVHEQAGVELLPPR